MTDPSTSQNKVNTDLLANRIARLATYMPFGSYVVYTTLQTYAFSITPMPATASLFVNTTVKTQQGDNYTCLVEAPLRILAPMCTQDQHDALIVALAVGFFMSLFLSFVKRVPPNGTPPTVIGTIDGAQVKLRFGIIYAPGANYYMDFGDHFIWGHACLSFIAFGTLTLFSTPVSQCLFPESRSWIFVMTQLLGLIACSFIGMFWIKDDTLSIETTVHVTENVVASDKSSAAPVDDARVSHVSSTSSTAAGDRPHRVQSMAQIA